MRAHLQEVFHELGVGGERGSRMVLELFFIVFLSICISELNVAYRISPEAVNLGLFSIVRLDYSSVFS